MPPTHLKVANIKTPSLSQARQMTREELEKLPRAQLIELAQAQEELKRRQLEEKAFFYKPCGPKHIAFHASDRQIRIFFGGNRSGKSTAGLLELVYMSCFKKHPLTGRVNRKAGHYRIFTEKYRLVESFIIPQLQTWVPRKALRGGSWPTAYDSRNNILHLVGGGTIDILTYESDVAGAASVELDGVWADEEMPERLYNETITRLISRGGRIWLTVTPMYSMTWAMDFWDTVNDPIVEVFKVSIHDNPNLPEKEKQAIISQWSDNERTAREKGEFMEFSGKVYKELESDVHFLKDWTFPSFYCPVVLSVDPHPRKPTVCTWSCVTPNDDVVFFDELEIAGTAAEIVAAIRRKESEHKALTYLRLIDPAANKQVSGIGQSATTLSEFENAGMNFSLADNSEAGYNVVHEYLAYDKSKAIDNFNRPRCYFTSGVPKTWHAMTHLLWDEYRNKDSKDPKERVKDFRKDFPDTVRYALAFRPGHGFHLSEPVSINYQL